MTIANELALAIDFIVELAAEVMPVVDEGDRAGWYDSCANGTYMAVGDYLVEQGRWERHPDGVGRRWYYRRKGEHDG